MPLRRNTTPTDTDPGSSALPAGHDDATGDWFVRPEHRPHYTAEPGDERAALSSGAPELLELRRRVALDRARATFDEQQARKAQRLGGSSLVRTVFAPVAMDTADLLAVALDPGDAAQALHLYRRGRAVEQHDLAVAEQARSAAYQQAHLCAECGQVDDDVAPRRAVLLEVLGRDGAGRPQWQPERSTARPLHQRCALRIVACELLDAADWADGRRAT